MSAETASEGVRVFAGNLPFTTTEDDLKAFFAPHAVTSSTIIHRGTRSLGYGFVTFATQEEAEKAVQDCDKKSLGDRDVNVEVAKAKVESTEPRAPRTRGRPFRPRGGAVVNGTGQDTADPAAFSAPALGRGRGRGRGRAAYAAEGEAPPASAAEGEDGAPFVPRGRGRGRGARGGRGRGTGRPIGEVDQNSEMSKTMLFVANVPFTFTDEDLKGVFGGFEVASAHVVKMKNGRSKGFGFIEAKDEKGQAKILAECTNIEAEGRELVIRAARASQVKVEDEATA